MISKRKAYVRPISPVWWQKSGFYRFYMLREGTAIPALWFSVELIFALYALKQGADSWHGFIVFLQHPITLLLNVMALLGALLHSKTWFELAPKATILIIKEQKMAAKPVIVLLWTITVLATLAVLAIALLA